VRRQPGACGVASPPMRLEHRFGSVRCALPAGHDAAWLSPPPALHVSADGVRFRVESTAAEGVASGAATGSVRGSAVNHREVARHSSGAAGQATSIES
jgi:hypothetical protein